jgi:TonB family protein
MVVGTPVTPDSDNRFVVVILLSIVIHLGFIYYLKSVDISQMAPITVEEMPQRIAKLIMNKPQPKEIKKVESDKGIEKKVEETVEKALTPEAAEKVAAEVQVKQKKAAQAQVAQRAVKVEKELRSTGMLALLTGAGPTRSRSRSAVDILGGQGVKGTNLDEALKGVTGVSRAGSEADLEKTLTTRRVVSTEEKVSISDMVKGFGSASKQMDKLGDIQVSKPKTIGAVPQSANRDETAITDFIKKNMRSILAEYNRLLKINPGLTGKVTIRFTITPAGNVIDVEVAESTITDESLQNRMVRVISNWVFPAIGSTEGNLTVNYPFVFQPN